MDAPVVMVHNMTDSTQALCFSKGVIMRFHLAPFEMAL